MKKKPNAIIHLKRETRNGILYLSSEDLPGLWLWGKDPENVFSNVAPTITKLYELNEGVQVEIRETKHHGIMGRWFGRDRICDTFEVYYLNKLGGNVSHDRFAME